MRRLAVLLATVLLAACGGDTPATTTPAAGITGTWQAISINGTSFPVAFNSLNLVDYADVITVRQDGGYTRLTTSGFANATSRSTFQELGHWGASGSAFILAPNVPVGIASYRATLIGDDLRVEIGNQVWIYGRS